MMQQVDNVWLLICMSEKRIDISMNERYDVLIKNIYNKGFDVSLCFDHENGI